MRQVLQSLRTGKTEVAEVPCPRPGPGQLLIRTRATVISAGTERMLVDFGNAGWIEKARQQPDKVRMVLDKIRTDGIAPTVEAVMRKLDQPMPMGYCSVGEVVEVGAGVTGFAPGDRVASNGRHAECVVVPMHLCARVPDEVPDEAAAFTVLGAIALQGLRLAQPALGESFAVIGLGLVGLMAVQLLRAQGCRVFAIDPDPSRAALARRFGAEAIDLAPGEDAMQAALRFSRGVGVDGVVIAASTESSDPVHQAALMCRKRGRIVLVGVTGLELSRADFYEKELSFQVSCSYGPGRYDPEYEEKGRDYPIGYVRWTEQRNFSAVLDLMAQGKLDVAPLVSHRFAIGEAEKAYALLRSGEPSLGVLLAYPAQEAVGQAARTSIRVAAPAASGQVAIGFIGAGNYASGTLIPAFRAAGARLKVVASASGVSGTHAARKYGIEESTTDARSLVADPEIAALVVSTRHRSHAHWVCEAIAAGKHVFVEKPLAMTLAEIERIEQAHRASAAPACVMVGFNRRFAPHVLRMRELLATMGGPKSFVMTVNAGAVPEGHWTQDAEEGGGRILGEACHFIDLLRFLAGAPIAGHSAHALREADERARIPDTANIELAFGDGSIGAIHYVATGHKGFPKERLEVFGGGKVLRLDNFRRLEGFGWPGFRGMRLWRQDKGNAACVAAFVRAIRNGEASPIPFDELIEVSRVAVQVSEAL
jgi:predicted dehydrogenase